MIQHDPAVHAWTHNSQPELSSYGLSQARQRCVVVVVSGGGGDGEGNGYESLDPQYNWTELLWAFPGPPTLCRCHCWWWG